ncbi:radical SAM protein [Collimonas fungivorans]|uniref:radical SAM protein n=1 Tax=Collimonas fungivorans TaxID=158899 RepID=UPI003FA373B1
MIIVWRITERCNLACAFCAYDRRLDFPRRDVDAAVVERLAPLLAEYQATTGDPVLVSWIGGEPLLWKPFFHLSRLLKNAHGIKTSTTTNGSTLHSLRVRADILETLAELTVSIDGLAEFHDAVRGWRGGWERLESSIAALVRERAAIRSSLKLRANVVLMHDNLTQFSALCNILAGWGFDEITFNQLGGRDRPEYFAARRLTPDDAAAMTRFIPQLQEELSLRGVRLCASEPYLQRILASAGDMPLAVADCSPGQRFLFIDELSRAGPCNFTLDEFGVPLSAISHVRDLQRLPQVFSRAQRQARHAACQDCPSTQVSAKFTS